MSMLRTVATLWVASLVGVAFAFAFLLLTDPFASRAIEGLVGGSIFVVGCVAGYIAVSGILNLVAQLRPHPATESARTVSA